MAHKDSDILHLLNKEGICSFGLHWLSSCQLTLYWKETIDIRSISLIHKWVCNLLQALLRSYQYFWHKDQLACQRLCLTLPSAATQSILRLLTFSDAC